MLLRHTFVFEGGMFKKKIVFVVGAGGSFEVGLPVGNTLKGILRDKLDIKNSGSWDASGDGQIVRAIAQMAKDHGNYGKMMGEYSAASQAIRNAMPQAISIDNFLHTHAEDPNIVLMGKLGIGSSILQSENTSKIYSREKGRYQLDFASTPDSWHNSFCRMLTEGVKRDSLDAIFDNVTFITFNYDRCIEHYVLMWLITYMRLTWEEGYELCRKITVFHPYGQVGKLPWQVPNGEGLDFGTVPDEWNIPFVAKQIRTFTERVEDDEILSQMRAAISQCEQLVYLGFSFGQMNMDLLKLEKAGPLKTVYATTFGMSDANKVAITQRIMDSTSVDGRGALAAPIGLRDTTALSLMNDHWYSLST